MRRINVIRSVPGYIFSIVFLFKEDNLKKNAATRFMRCAVKAIMIS